MLRPLFTQGRMCLAACRRSIQYTFPLPSGMVSHAGRVYQSPCRRDGAGCAFAANSSAVRLCSITFSSQGPSLRASLGTNSPNESWDAIRWA